MPDKSFKAADRTRQLIVEPDVKDLRDRRYTVSLAPLAQEMIPEPGELNVRDQRDESACTGFALAAVIDRQCGFRDLETGVSTRMLYEMAKLHDDIPDHDNPGSTLRGALKGFFHNGVCLEKDAAFTRAPGLPPWELDIKTAKEARNLSLGAYYRLDHEINDYHAAINAAGAVIASARIHSGWANPRSGVIKTRSRLEGRHAFSVVGYTREGFIIQNSWGEDWGGYKGLKGVALWSYSDWFENVEDAWVLRLAVSAPSAFDIKFARNHAVFRDAASGKGASGPAPRRQSINGHFLHLDDGTLVGHGRYAQTMGSLDKTVELIRKGTSNGDGSQSPYKHLLIFGHGALNDQKAIATRIKAWRDVFKLNGIYPIHIMWKTGFNSDVVNVVQNLLWQSKERMGSEGEHLEARLEQMARPLGRKLWRDLKRTAEFTFRDDTDGGVAIRKLLSAAMEQPRLDIHFASVSAGAFLLGELADVALDLGTTIKTASLLAPACSADHYDARIRHRVGLTIDRIMQYSLIDSRERDDTLDIYSKSLLYLVSNALEEPGSGDLLGMENGLDTFGQGGRKALPPEHDIAFAGRAPRVTNSTTHQGFDRDEKTMNSVLATILGERPPSRLRFKSSNLMGY